MKNNYLVALFYIGGEAQGSEIQLAIEGWRQHFKEPFRLIVVGDDPKVEGVEWLEIERVPGKEGEYRPSLDICNKLEEVCTFCEYHGYKHFIWASDDFFAVNDFTIEDVEYPKYLDDEMPILGVMHPNWFERTQVKTRLLCQKEGFGIKNWTTHLPMLFNVANLHKIIRDYDLTNNGYIVENIYFNAYPPKGEPFKLCLNDRWKFSVIYQPLDREGFQNALRNKIWVCCSVHGWSQTLDRELRKHYGLPELDDGGGDKKSGFVIIGKLPNAKCIPVSYTPSAQELTNMRVLFGMDYMTAEEMEAYEKSLDKDKG